MLILHKEIYWQDLKKSNNGKNKDRDSASLEMTQTNQRFSLGGNMMMSMYIMLWEQSTKVHMLKEINYLIVMGNN